MANPKIELSTGKVVEILPKRDVGTEYRALKLCGAKAATDGGEATISLAENLLTEIAYTFVQVVEVDGKKAAEIGTGVEGDEILISFRRHFTDGEWAELKAAIDEVAPQRDAKAPVGKYRIIYT
jgi:hypothetical protein